MFSPLLVPCDDPEAVAAASLSGAGALVLDLGAADAPGDRAARRRAAVEAMLRQHADGVDVRSGAPAMAFAVRERPHPNIDAQAWPPRLPSPLWRGAGGEGEATRSQPGTGDGPRRGTPDGPSPLALFHDGEGRRPASHRTGMRGSGGDADDTMLTAPKGGGRPAVIVRLASLASGLIDADLDVVMAGAPDAVLLPRALGACDLQHLAAKLAVREAERGLPAGRTRIVALPADTATGVLALAGLPGATPRLLALGWDAAALAAGLGVGVEASPVRAARDLLLVAAAAAGVPAIDRGLASDDLAVACRAARRDGFAIRLARGPAEVAAIAAAFGPDRG